MKNAGFWDKIDMLVESCEIVIDRPKGSRHPRYNYIYELDYGYLKDTSSPDGAGIDVWHGSLPQTKCSAVVCTVDVIKRESEIKLLIGCTDEEMKTVLRFHNSSESMGGVLINREG